MAIRNTGNGTYKIDGDPHTYCDVTDACIWCGNGIADDPVECVKLTPTKKGNGKSKRKKGKGVSGQRPAQLPPAPSGTALSKTSKKQTYIGKAHGACRDTHPVLKLGKGEFLGGSCSSPRVDDFDVYIGFQVGMRQTYRRFPWKQGTEFEYGITDMCAPKDVVSFKKLIAWAAKQLEDGKRVHAGCIGGHGRTGLFLAALINHMTGEEDAIVWARKHYCKKAVESVEQIEWLGKHFGIKPAEPTKPRFVQKGSALKWDDHDFDMHPGAPAWAKGGTKTGRISQDTETISPIPANASVWGEALEEE